MLAIKMAGKWMGLEIASTPSEWNFIYAPEMQKTAQNYATGKTETPCTFPCVTLFGLSVSGFQFPISSFLFFYGVLFYVPPLFSTFSFTLLSFLSHLFYRLVI